MLLKAAAELEGEIQEANRQLATRADVPASVQETVRRLAQVITDTAADELTVVDPYLVIAVEHAALAALRALDLPDERERRQRLRVSLEQARHALRDLVEGEPTGEQRPAKEVAVWLDAVLDVPQRHVADLLGVGQRQYQRWISPNDPAEPHGDDAQRVRTLARLVANLRHALTGPGVVAWLRRPQPGLEGQAPATLLRRSDAGPALLRLATRARSARAV